MAAEFLKYGGPELHEAIAELLNAVFIRHESIPDLKAGLLIALNKPSKKTFVENTRPIILLTALRKILSLIVYERMGGRVSAYLPLSQHAYLPGRSTGEFLWSLQYLRSIAERFGERAHILKLDLEKAFDSLDRQLLLNILRDNKLCDEDELRMIQFLLSDTTLRARVDGKLGSTFSTLIGTPQGDGLSPILFIIYLAHILYLADPFLRDLVLESDLALTYADDHLVALRETVNQIAERATCEALLAAEFDRGERADTTHLPTCNCVLCQAHKIPIILSEHLATYRMKLDPGKTLHREITSKSTDLDKTMGCVFEYKALMKSRRANADVAFYSMNSLWLKGAPVSDPRKLTIYNAICLPHFTHTGGAIALRQVDLDLLDSRHRVQLRKLLCCFYPDSISNQDLYLRADTRPISIMLLAARWRLLGHIERRSPDLPAHQTMLQLLAQSEDGPALRATWKGGKRTFLHKMLCQDLQQLPEEVRLRYFGVTKFTTENDLLSLREHAQDRAQWRRAVFILSEAAFVNWQKRDSMIAARQRLAQERVAERAASGTAPRRRKITRDSTASKQAYRRARSKAKTYAAGQTRGGGKGPRKLKPPKPKPPRSTDAQVIAARLAVPPKGIRKFFSPNPK
jgi:hypothetical protein